MSTPDKIKYYLSSFGEVLEAFLKIIVLSKFNLKLPVKKGDEIAYFANGPSFEKALEKISKVGVPENIMVSNFFCESSFFKKLQPNHYIICDPLFIEEDILSNPKIKSFYETIYKSDWEINFFVPYSFKKDLYSLKKNLKLNNDNIKIFYYNNTNFNGNSSLLLHLFKTRLGIPRPTTVAIPALMACMHMGYRNIKIGGIDLDQHNHVKVTKNNNVFFEQKHFYDTTDQEKSNLANKHISSVNLTVSELFLIFYNFFHSFDIVAKYANKYHIEIHNYSENSFLDQFKKI